MYTHTHKVNSSNLSGKLEHQLPNLGDTGQGASQTPHAGQTTVQLQVYQSTEVPSKAIPELFVFNLPCPNAQHMGPGTPMSQLLKEVKAGILEFKVNLDNTARLHFKTTTKKIIKVNVLSLKRQNSRAACRARGRSLREIIPSQL